MIYFILQSSGKFSQDKVKVGYTGRSAAERIKDMKTGNPDHMRCIYELSDNNPLNLTEREIHNDLKEYNVTGEWFVYNRAVRKYIENIKSEIDKIEANKYKDQQRKHDKRSQQINDNLDTTAYFNVGNLTTTYLVVFTSGGITRVRGPYKSQPTKRYKRGKFTGLPREIVLVKLIEWNIGGYAPLQITSTKELDAVMSSITRYHKQASIISNEENSVIKSSIVVDNR